MSPGVAIETAQSDAAHPDHDQVDVDGRPGIRQGPPGPEVEREQDQPAGQVAHRERDRGRADRVRGAGRAAGDRAGGQQFGQPEDQVVGVEPVGVQREADPGEPDRDEQAGELGQPEPAEVVDEGDGQLHDHQDVRQVEEQLQPAGGALPPQVQPGRPDHRDRSGLAFLGLHRRSGRPRTPPAGPRPPRPRPARSRPAAGRPSRSRARSSGSSASRRSCRDGAGRVAGLDQHRRIPDQFLDAADPGADQRQPGQQRLLGHQRPGLPGRGQQRDIGRGQQRAAARRDDRAVGPPDPSSAIRRSSAGRSGPSPTTTNRRSAAIAYAGGDVRDHGPGSSAAPAGLTVSTRVSSGPTPSSARSSVAVPAVRDR